MFCNWSLVLARENLQPDASFVVCWLRSECSTGEREHLRVFVCSATHSPLYLQAAWRQWPCIGLSPPPRIRLLNALFSWHFSHGTFLASGTGSGETNRSLLSLVGILREREVMRSYQPAHTVRSSKISSGCKLKCSVLARAHLPPACAQSHEQVWH